MHGLSEFQEQVLEAFFASESGFFLTGSAALTGYHIHHRETRSVKLMTLDDRVRAGEAALLEAAGQVGAKAKRLDAPEAVGKFLLQRDDQSFVVDIERDLCPQLEPDKMEVGKIRVDGPKEILARLLCALPTHCAMGELLDLRALEIAGHTVEDNIAAATHRDPNLSVADLVQGLSEIEFEDDELPSGDVAAADLRSYLAVLSLRLTSLAARM